MKYCCQRNRRFGKLGLALLESATNTSGCSSQVELCYWATQNELTDDLQHIARNRFSELPPNQDQRSDARLTAVY